MKTKNKRYTNEQLMKIIARLAKKRGLDFYPSYSGRFMFGATCIGFEGGRTECAALAYLIEKKTGLTANWDNMGLNFIYYFPDIRGE